MTTPAEGDAPAPAPGQADVLAFDRVTAGYGRTTILRDVTLSVAPGEAVALLGPNGAGKTTLLRTALGFVRPSSGSVSSGGRDLGRLSPERRSRAGICFIREGRGVFKQLTVRENLRLQIPRGAKHADVELALAMFPKLRERLGQRAGTLSGGEQQMLAVARCFSTKPRVVLLDEVSMGLAPIIVGQIFDALAQLREFNVSILLVEQYVNRALGMADRVHLLDRGRISFSGRPGDLTEEEIMRKYMNVYVEQASP
jgi:branched-chain amino acid transport system ATP-binding protein